MYSYVVCMDFTTAGRTDRLSHDVRKKKLSLCQILITEIIDASNLDMITPTFCSPVLIVSSSLVVATTTAGSHSHLHSTARHRLFERATWDGNKLDAKPKSKPKRVSHQPPPPSSGHLVIWSSDLLVFWKEGWKGIMGVTEHMETWPPRSFIYSICCRLLQRLLLTGTRTGTRTGNRPCSFDSFDFALNCIKRKMHKEKNHTCAAA